DPCCLVSGCCSSGRDFVPRFLQTVPRSSALALHSCFTSIRLHRGLSPPDCWTCPAHIGIGGRLTTPPLPHHRAYGSVPRRFGGLSTRGCRAFGFGHRRGHFDLSHGRTRGFTPARYRQVQRKLEWRSHCGHETSELLALSFNPSSGTPSVPTMMRHLPPREFRPAGAEGSSRSCPCCPPRTMPRRAPPRMEAVGRRSWRRPPRRPPNYRTDRAGGRSRHGTSCASLPRPTAPSRPVGLVRFCAAKASTPQPCVIGAANATPAPSTR